MITITLIGNADFIAQTGTDVRTLILWTAKWKCQWLYRDSVS